MKTQPEAYDPFAWIYNQHWGNSFLPTILPIIDNLILNRLKKNARILDLCCGTGQLAGKISALGYRVTGIDGSPSMLKYARENAPKVKLLQKDARTFAVPIKFHAAVSVFDSLNHIMTLKELTSVFSRVYAALHEGGLFLCDLNTEPGYLYEWSGTHFTIVEEDHVCVVENTYNTRRRIATFDATIFRYTNGNWYRNDVKIYQKCHAPSRIKSALKSVGFKDVEVFGIDTQVGLQQLTPNMRRAFFYCRKP
jgi:SAM-dependent methyltransferase